MPKGYYINLTDLASRLNKRLKLSKAPVFQNDLEFFSMVVPTISLDEHRFTIRRISCSNGGGYGSAALTTNAGNKKYWDVLCLAYYTAADTMAEIVAHDTYSGQDCNLAYWFGAGLVARPAPILLPQPFRMAPGEFELLKIYATGGGNISGAMIVREYDLGD